MGLHEESVTTVRVVEMVEGAETQAFWTAMNSSDRNTYCSLIGGQPTILAYFCLEKINKSYKWCYIQVWITFLFIALVLFGIC